MAFSNQPVDSNDIPMANVYVPGSGFIATQGSTTTNTDGQNNNSTPVNINIVQIDSNVVDGLIGADDIPGNGILKVVAVYQNADGGYDEPRNNFDNYTLINASNVTTTQTSAHMVNYNGLGVIVVLDMIDASASPSVSLSIIGVEPVTGATWTILTGSAVTANGANVYRVYPGLTAVANATANDILPRTWYVSVAANNTNSATYKVCMIQFGR